MLYLHQSGGEIPLLRQDPDPIARCDNVMNVLWQPSPIGYAAGLPLDAMLFRRRRVSAAWLIGWNLYASGTVRNGTNDSIATGARTDDGSHPLLYRTNCPAAGRA